jgi:hypothetical protein
MAMDDLGETRRFSPLDETGLVFVDHTGVRRRRVGWLVVGIAVLALLFVGLLWLSQSGRTVEPVKVQPCASSSTAPARSVDVCATSQPAVDEPLSGDSS